MVCNNANHLCTGESVEHETCINKLRFICAIFTILMYVFLLFQLTTVWCLVQKRFVGMLNDLDCWKTKLGKEKMGSLAALGRKVNGFMRR